MSQVCRQLLPVAQLTACPFDRFYSKCYIFSGLKGVLTLRLSRLTISYLLLLLFVLGQTTALYPDDLPWDASAQPSVSVAVHETNILRAFFGRAIRFFQTRISTIDGPRCSFMPTCSEYARLSIKEYGAGIGLVMALDRLQRCNYCAAHYYPIKNGRLLDPPSANALIKRGD